MIALTALFTFILASKLCTIYYQAVFWTKLKHAGVLIILELVQVCWNADAGRRINLGKESFRERNNNMVQIPARVLHFTVVLDINCVWIDKLSNRLVRHYGQLTVPIYIMPRIKRLKRIIFLDLALVPYIKVFELIVEVELAIVLQCRTAGSCWLYVCYSEINVVSLLLASICWFSFIELDLSIFFIIFKLIPWLCQLFLFNTSLACNFYLSRKSCIMIRLILICLVLLLHLCIKTWHLFILHWELNPWSRYFLLFSVSIAFRRLCRDICKSSLKFDYWCLIRVV